MSMMSCRLVKQSTRLISLRRGVTASRIDCQQSSCPCHHRRLLTSSPRTQQQQQQQHASAETSSQAQKSAYAYYQRQRQGAAGPWSRLRRKLWPKKKTKRATTSQAQRNVNTAWYSAAVVVGALGATYAAVPLYKVFCQTTGFGGTTQRVRIIGSSESDANSAAAASNSSSMSESVGMDLVSTVDYVFASISKKFTETFFPSPTTPGSSSSRSAGGARVHTWTDEEAAARLASLKPVANADLMTIRFDTTVGDVMPWSFVPVQLDVKVVPGETALSFFRVTNHSDKAITGVATYNVHPAKVGLYFQKIQCFCFEEQRLLPGETVDMPVFFFIDPEILQDPQVSYVRSITLSYTFFQTDEDDLDDDDEEDDDETTAK